MKRLPPLPSLAALADCRLLLDPTGFNDVMIKVRHLVQLITRRSLFRIVRLERADEAGYTRLSWEDNVEALPIESLYRLGNVRNPLDKNIDGPASPGGLPHQIQRHYAAECQIFFNYDGRPPNPNASTTDLWCGTQRGLSLLTRPDSGKISSKNFP